MSGGPQDMPLQAEGGGGRTDSPDPDRDSRDLPTTRRRAARQLDRQTPGVDVTADDLVDGPGDQAIVSPSLRRDAVAAQVERDTGLERGQDFELGRRIKRGTRGGETVPTVELTEQGRDRLGDERDDTIVERAASTLTSGGESVADRVPGTSTAVGGASTVEEVATRPLRRAAAMAVDPVADATRPVRDAVASGASAVESASDSAVETTQEQVVEPLADNVGPGTIGAGVGSPAGVQRQTEGGEGDFESDVARGMLGGLTQITVGAPSLAVSGGRAGASAVDTTAENVAREGLLAGGAESAEALGRVTAETAAGTERAFREEPVQTGAELFATSAVASGAAGPAIRGARAAGAGARAAGARARQAAPDRQELRAFVDDERARAGGGMRPSRDPDAGPDGAVGTAEFPEQGREREVAVQRQREADSGDLLPDDFDGGELAPREAVALARDQFDRPDAAGRRAVEERAAALQLESRARQQNVPFDARQQRDAVEQARQQVFEGADIDLLPAQAQRQQQRQTAATAALPAAGGVTAAVGAQLSRGQDQAVDQAVTLPATDGETVEATADPTTDQRVDELFAAPGTDGETVGIFDEPATQDVTEDAIVPGVSGETVGAFDQPPSPRPLLTRIPPDNGGGPRFPRPGGDDEFLPDTVLDVAAGAWASPVAGADDVAASLFAQPRGET